MMASHNAAAPKTMVVATVTLPISRARCHAACDGETASQACLKSMQRQMPAIIGENTTALRHETKGAVLGCSAAALYRKSRKSTNFCRPRTCQNVRSAWSGITSRAHAKRVNPVSAAKRGSTRGVRGCVEVAMIRRTTAAHEKPGVIAVHRYCGGFERNSCRKATWLGRKRGVSDAGTTNNTACTLNPTCP